MSVRLASVIFFFYCCQSLFSQTISGVVLQQENAQPLPFATLVLSNGTTVFTNAEGQFSFTNTKINHFTARYTGFESKKTVLTIEKTYYKILLKETISQLQEVVVSEENNPAFLLMKKVVARKTSNNPEEQLQSFSFKQYDKLIVTANPDSIKPTIDSLKINNITVIDSSMIKFKKSVTERHLYQTEKISEIAFNKNQRRKETILASRMAGFQNPIYEVIGFQLQNFSVYDENINLLETTYNNPVHKKGLRDYRYTILDSIQIQNRKNVVVYFKEKRKSRTTKLEGVLFVDAENYAISKAIYQTKGKVEVTATYFFDYLEQEKLWFLKSKKLHIVKSKMIKDLSVSSGAISISQKSDSKNTPSNYLYLLSESKVSERNLNLQNTIKRASFAIEVVQDANAKTEEYWNKYRGDTLDVRSQPTYQKIDSLIAKNKVESKIQTARRLLDGYVPIGKIDWDIRSLVKYNNYEGFRLGLGGITNEKWHKKFKMEAYWAYGLKDKAMKWSLATHFQLDYFTNTWLKIGYKDDVQELATTALLVDEKSFKLYDPRPFNLTTFYRAQTAFVSVRSAFIPKIDMVAMWQQSYVTPLFNYQFLWNGKRYTNFYLNAFTLAAEWEPQSQMMQTPQGRITTKNALPKFSFQFTQSLPNVLKNDFPFAKFDVKIAHELQLFRQQKTALLAQAGVILGDVPVTHLYSVSPNSLDRETVLQRLTIASKNGFETMRFNEFFSSEYLSLQLKHSLKKIKIAKDIEPQLVAVTRAAWGNSRKPEQHIGIRATSFNKGYFESGLELNQIYKGFGITGFYRYGPYGMAKLEDNLSIKLSFVLDLGF